MMTFVYNYEELLLWLMIVSIIGLIASLVVIPGVIVQLPSDYFLHEKRKKYLWKNQPPLVRLAIILIKNILGIMFIISGIIMLFIPGQGILTIIMGIILADLPHKYKIERRIIKNPRLLSAINKLRTKAKKSPLEI